MRPLHDVISRDTLIKWVLAFLKQTDKERPLMAWKHLKQRSFADDLLVEHTALTELDDAHDFLDWSRIELRLSEVHNKPSGEKAWLPLRYNESNAPWKLTLVQPSAEV